MVGYPLWDWSSCPCATLGRVALRAKKPIILVLTIGFPALGLESRQKFVGRGVEETPPLRGDPAIAIFLRVIRVGALFLGW